MTTPIEVPRAHLVTGDELTAAIKAAVTQIYEELVSDLRQQEAGWDKDYAAMKAPADKLAATIVGGLADQIEGRYDR